LYLPDTAGTVIPEGLHDLHFQLGEFKSDHLPPQYIHITIIIGVTTQYAFSMGSGQGNFPCSMSFGGCEQFVLGALATRRSTHTGVQPILAFSVIVS
jgi:hypothetical protein